MAAPAVPAIAQAASQLIQEIIKLIGEVESSTGKMPRPPGK